MEYPFKVKVNTEDDTSDLAHSFIKTVVPGDVIILNGNLGAGKTFFVKKALKATGIENVNSPTFAIVNEYSGEFKFYHFDFYRINEIGELYDIGFNDYLNDPDAAVFIEWGSLMPEILPHKRTEINIVINEDFSREFEFIKYE